MSGETHHVHSATENSGREASLLGRLRALSYDRNVLMRLQLEVTKRCNLRCQHCYVTEQPDGLTSDRIMALFDEAAEEGCLTVTLTGGEIALRSDWLELARGVRERRMMLNVFTNGTLLSEGDCLDLAALKPMFMGLSLYGPRAEIHDRVTGVRGSFERTVSAIRRLRALGVTCEIKNVLMHENMACIEETGGLARGLECSYQFDPTVAPRADGDCSVLAHRVGGEALREFYMSMVSRKDMDMLSRKACDVMAQSDPAKGTATNCSAGFSSIHVEADGNVYPCMGFLPSWGNVNEKSLGELWHGPMARQHRATMQRPLLECSDCDLLAYCTARCPRVALVEDGDVSGPSRRACEVAGLVKEMHDRLMVYSES